MGKYNKNTSIKKSNEQKFYEKVVRQIGALIIHSVGATLFILVTILLGVECATSGGFWIYLLSFIICIAVTIASIGAIIVDTCNMLLFIRRLHDGKKGY
jgi:uncharacterized membrane protein